MTKELSTYDGSNKFQFDLSEQPKRVEIVLSEGVINHSILTNTGDVYVQLPKRITNNLTITKGSNDNYRVLIFDRERKILQVLMSPGESVTFLAYVPSTKRQF